MFKVVESLLMNPIRFPIKPGAKLLPGNVVSIVDYKNSLVIDLCDGNNPFGLLGNRCFGGNSINFSRKAMVYPQRMIVDINRFDRENDIEIGDSLYCSKQGILSSQKPFDNSFMLAKVITPANTQKNHMQILWL
jgi:hypothetical protein